MAGIKTEFAANKSVCCLADVNKRVGTGHVWRTGRLAHALRDAGLEVACAVPDNATARRSVAAFTASSGTGMPFTFLAGDPGESSAAPAFHPLPDAVVADLPQGHGCYILDSYRVTPGQMRSLRAKGKHVVVLDDFDHRGLKAGDADIVINPGLPASEMPYHGLRLLSPPYCHLIPKSFFAPSPDRDPAAVILTFGGTDQGHMGLRLLDLMVRRYPELARSGLNFKVVVPVPETEQIYRADALARKLGPHLEILRTYDAADFFRSGGSIICASGMTALEAQAAELSFVAGSILNETQDAIGAMLEHNKILVQDLKGILDGKDVTDKMENFAAGAGRVLLDGAAVTLPRQNADGRDNLVREIVSFVQGPPQPPLRHSQKPAAPV